MVLAGALARLVPALALTMSCASLLNGDKILQDHRPAPHGQAPRLSALSPAARVRVSWWTRGGEPGPGWSSDKLEVAATGDRVTGTYVRARFDSAFNPPFKPEEWTGDLPPAIWDALSAAIDGEQVLTRHLAAEDKGDLADALKDTVEVSVDGHVTAKSLYDLSDRDLPHSRAAVKAVAAHLVAHGRYRLVKPSAER